MRANAAWQAVLKLKPVWCGGITHLMISRLELMQRPAALVSRPGPHLTRLHGVLAPNAKLRALVVPQQYRTTRMGYTSGRVLGDLCVPTVRFG